MLHLVRIGYISQENRFDIKMHSVCIQYTKYSTIYYRLTFPYLNCVLVLENHKVFCQLFLAHIHMCRLKLVWNLTAVLNSAAVEHLFSYGFPCLFLGKEGAKIHLWTYPLSVECKNWFSLKVASSFVKHV